MTKMCSNPECKHPNGPKLQLSEFSSRKDGKDGLRARCKICSDRKEYSKQHYLANREKRLQQCKEYRKLDRVKEYQKEYKRQWKLNNPEHMKDYLKDYNLKYPEKKVIKASKRRAAKLRRTPLWANIDKIAEAYKDCIEINIAARLAGCTEKFVVDHIVPLQGVNVSGLHIDSNLQIITAKANLEKSNKFNPKFGV